VTAGMSNFLSPADLCCITPLSRVGGCPPWPLDSAISSDTLISLGAKSTAAQEMAPVGGVGGNPRGLPLLG